MKVNCVLINDKEYKRDELFCLEDSTEKYGLIQKVYKVNSKFGYGNKIEYFFEGVEVVQSYVKLNSDYLIRYNEDTNSYTFSFSGLLKGEKKIFFLDKKSEIIQENNEGHVLYGISKEVLFCYCKNQTIQEIEFKLSDKFIKKHSLQQLLENNSKLTSGINSTSTYHLKNRVQQIIVELMGNKQSGLVKRLFLESKLLEIIALGVDEKDNFRIQKGISTNAKKIYLAKKLIVKNLDVQLSIKQLSKQVFLNEHILKKEFKRVFGVTVFEFAFQKRMEKAKELLANTSKPIYEIAEIVGYRNPTHFSAAFKKVELITPKFYRNNINLSN